MSETIQIPKGWKLNKLDDVCKKITSGGTPSRDNPSYFNGDILWVKMNDMKKELILDTKEKITKEGLDNSSAKIFLKNTVLLAMYTEDMGRTSILGKNASTNQAICGLETNNKILPKFLFYFLKSQKKVIDKLGTGGAQPNINQGKVKNLQIIYPLLNTQQIIITKLDHILGELEIKKKEILKLKEKKESAMSKLSQKTIGGMILKHMKIGDIPKNWQIKTLEDCVDIQAGFAKGEKNVVNGIIHLRMNNIGRNFELNYDLTRTINATKEQLIKYKLEKDDVIFNNTNSPELVGKSVIFNDDKVCLYSNHLTRCRVNKELLLPEWLLFYIRGKWLRRDFENMCNKWINQAAFGGNKLKELKIPIPPLDEQKRILKILKNTSIQFERISNLTKAIKNRDEQNKKFIDNIESSILDSAFSGKLLK